MRGKNTGAPQASAGRDVDTGVPQQLIVDYLPLVRPWARDSKARRLIASSPSTIMGPVRSQVSAPPVEAWQQIQGFRP